MILHTLTLTMMKTYIIYLKTVKSKKNIRATCIYTWKSDKTRKTLIIFDEVTQECPNALNALKYFQEEANEYHIVCAGSLLGIRLSHTTFPVGKVDF